MTNTPISQVPNGQAITGVTAAAVFTLDQCTIGATTPKAGTFTTLSATSGTFTTVSAATPILVSNGGTGLATLTANNVILGNGTSTPAFVAPSTSGNLLTSNGTTWVSSAAPASSSAVVLLNTLTASASASVSFTSTYLTTTYKEYIIVFMNVCGSAVLNMTASVDNGSNYLAGTNYSYNNEERLSDSTTIVSRNSAGTSSFPVTSVYTLLSAPRGTSGWMRLIDPLDATCYKYVETFVNIPGTSESVYLGGGVNILTTSAINNIKFTPASSNITSGIFKLYGVL